MLKKRVVAVLCSVLLGGCNSQEVKTEQVDYSGQFDGHLEFTFRNSARIQTSGVGQFTCATGKFTKSFVITGGEVWSDEYEAQQVGVVDTEGRLFIRAAGGNYSGAFGGNRQAYYLISGQFDRNRVINTSMVYAYSESNRGCKYTAEGKLASSKAETQKKRPEKRQVDVIWGKNTYSGDLIFTGEFTADNEVKVNFYSDTNSLSCRGSLKLTDEHTGNWDLDCGDGLTASGQYLQAVKYRSFLGEDLSGNSVSLLMPL